MSRIRIALIVSLLVNLFLVGGIVGGLVLLRARHPMIAAGALRVAGSELPVGERRAFRLALRDTRRTLRPQIETALAARAHAAALLRQPVLDQAALAQALAQARAADITVRATLENRAVQVAATLPPADRAKLADGLMRRAEARRPRR